MVLRLHFCCYCNSLLLGTTIIGWAYVVMSFMYIIGFLIALGSHPQPDHYMTFNDECEKHLRQYGEPISIPTAVASFVLGTFVLIAVYKRIAFFLGLAVIVLAVVTLAYFVLTFLFIACFALFAVFLLIAVFCLYSFLVLLSYFLELREKRRTPPVTNVTSNDTPNTTA